MDPQHQREITFADLPEPSGVLHHSTRAKLQDRKEACKQLGGSKRFTWAQLIAALVGRGKKFRNVTPLYSWHYSNLDMGLYRRLVPGDYTVESTAFEWDFANFARKLNGGAAPALPSKVPAASPRPAPKPQPQPRQPSADDRSAEVARLQQRIEELQGQQANLAAQVQQLEREKHDASLEALRSDSELKEVVAAHQAQVHELQAQLAEKDQRAQQLAEENQRLRAGYLAQLKGRLESLPHELRQSLLQQAQERVASPVR